jgi:flagellar biosynthesis protein FliQ
MTPDVALSLARETSMLLLIIAGPVLAVGLVVGLAVSVFQAVTQIQEMTLTFIPKLLGIMLVMALLGHFMLDQLLVFTTTLLNNLDLYAR